jgi:hypothetical protein
LSIFSQRFQLIRALWLVGVVVAYVCQAVGVRAVSVGDVYDVVMQGFDEAQLSSRKIVAAQAHRVSRFCLIHS